LVMTTGPVASPDATTAYFPMDDGESCTACVCNTCPIAPSGPGGSNSSGPATPSNTGGATNSAGVPPNGVGGQWTVTPGGPMTGMPFQGWNYQSP
jgi:hypothetical protein